MGIYEVIKAFIIGTKADRMIRDVHREQQIKDIGRVMW